MISTLTTMKCKHCDVLLAESDAGYVAHLDRHHPTEAMNQLVTQLEHVVKALNETLTVVKTQPVSSREQMRTRIEGKLGKEFFL